MGQSYTRYSSCWKRAKTCLGTKELELGFVSDEPLNRPGILFFFGVSKSPSRTKYEGYLCIFVTFEVRQGGIDV